MPCRSVLMGLVLSAFWMGLPREACGQEPLPVIFTGPLSSPREPDDGFRITFVQGRGIVYASRLTIIATDWRRIYAYAELGGISLAGLTCDVFLSSTPGGAFSAFADVEASALGAGPGFGVNWYVWESVTTSFRWNVFGGRTMTTTTIP